MRGKFLLITILSTFLFYSCKKNNQIENGVNAEKLTDVKVPEGFTWESSRDVTFKISVTDTRFNDAIHVISVFSPDGKLLSKGSASVNAPFNTRVYLPATITEVYVVKTAPDNSNVSQKVEVKATEISLSLGSVSTSAVSAKKGFSTLATSPDCNSGCSQSISLTQNGQSLTVQNGSTVCVSGSNKTFNVTFGTGGGTLRICGTALTVQNINKNAGTSAIQVIVTSGSSISFPGLELDRSNHVLQNYGTASFSSNLASSGTVNNYGTLTVSGDYNVNSGSALTHTNEGTLTVNGTLNVNSTSVYSNSGIATLNKLQVNSNATFNNTCKLTIIQGLIVDKILNNYGYVSVGASTQINGTAIINMYSGAMFVTNNLEKITGTFKGIGTTSLVKVTGTINSNLILDANQTTTGQKFTNALQLCYASALPSGLFKDGAVQGCNLYIAASGCTPGNGTATIVDSDGDGVADNLDDYPNDATKAYNNYYPSADSDAGSTVAFEDQWPAKGDYDMNDVVLSYNLKVITNAQNVVVQVSGTYDLQARGGIFQNGFGIEFPVNRSLVSNVTGGTLEEGQQKAVIILFTNMHAEMLYYNTRKEDPVLPAKSYPISFTVNNGPTLANFGLGEYNPFIWNRASGRGYEIHLPGKTPTTLANTSLFGTGSDNSSVTAGRYYITTEGYPWAISIPTKTFNYPIEGKDIATVYLKMPLWVASGGSSYTDWYSNTAAGYRNTTNIFK